MTLEFTLLLALGGLVDERLVNVRDDTTAGNGGLDESVQLFITSNRELQVTRSDTLDLQILASVSRQFQNLCSEIF